MPEAVDDTSDHLIPNIYELGKVENDILKKNDISKNKKPNIYELGKVENDILTIEEELEKDIEYTIYVKNGDNLESATTEEIRVVEKIDNDTYLNTKP